jgi:osmotically-inducible protein OsmY
MLAPPMGTIGGARKPGTSGDARSAVGSGRGVGPYLLSSQRTVGATRTGATTRRRCKEEARSADGLRRHHFGEGVERQMTLPLRLQVTICNAWILIL